VSQQVWHVKVPSLLKAMNAKHKLIFAALFIFNRAFLCRYIIHMCNYHTDYNPVIKAINCLFLSSIKATSKSCMGIYLTAF
jgi:hypothetical protein